MRSMILATILALALGIALVNVVGKQADAKAYAIQIEARHRAANQAQVRRHREAIFQVKQAEREAVAPYKIAARQNFIWTVGTAGIVLVVILAGSLSYLTVGLSKASVNTANLKASLIPLDRITRQYPLLVHQGPHGRFYLINANNGSVMKLDQAQMPLKQLVAGATQVQTLGVQQPTEDRYSIVSENKNGKVTND